jgi:hypothetical protein
MLCAVTNDFGHMLVATLSFAQTTRTGVSTAVGIQPHRRFVSKPDFRQVAHSQPAWSEN